MQGAILYMKNEGSFLLTVDRYLTHNYYFRPFLGGGIGSFNVTESGGCSGGSTATKSVHSTAPFGGMVRTGLESGHMRLSFEYNLVADTHVTDYEASGKSLATKSYSSAYFGITLGINIGGGLKK